MIFLLDCSLGLNLIGRARRVLRNNCLQPLHFTDEDSLRPRNEISYLVSARTETCVQVF